MNTVTITPLYNNISISGSTIDGNVSVSTISSPSTSVTVLQGVQGIQGPSGTSVSVSNYGNNRLLISNNTSSGVVGLSNITADENGIYIYGTGISISGHTHSASSIIDFNTSVSGLVSGIYQPILLNPVTGIGLSGYVPVWTSNSSLSTGCIIDDGSTVYVRNPVGTTSKIQISGFRSELDLITPTGLNPAFSYSIINFGHPSSTKAHLAYFPSGTAFGASNRLVMYGVGGILLTTTGGPFGSDVFINTSGNLGVGTTNPESKLHVVGSGLFSSGLNVSGILNIGNISINTNTISSTNNNGNLIIQTTGTGAIQRDSGGNSRGQYAVDLQNARSSGTQVAASNYSSILGGSGNQIVSDSIYSIINGGAINTISANGGYNSIIGGYANTISNYNSGDSNIICGGYGNTITGEYYGSAAIGGGEGNIIQTSADDQRVPAYATIPGGYEAKTTRWAEFSHAAGKFSNAGDAQHTILIARKLTTDNTANVILLLDNGISSSYKLELPNKTTWTFEVKLSAYNDTDSAGAGWIFRGAIRSDGSGDTSILGSIIEENWKDTAMSSTSANVVANDSTNSLDIRVTGLTGKNIRWVAVIDISQVCYGVP